MAEKRNYSSLAAIVARRASGRSDIGLWGAETFQQSLADALAGPAPLIVDNGGPPLVSRATHPVHQALG